MEEVKWNDRFNIGVEAIDTAHQKLFSIVGKLVVLNEDAKKQQHACREGINFFKNYTLEHFAQEEAYMQSIGYKGYAMHKSLHDNMRDKTLPALEKELEEQEYSAKSVRHFLGICIGWLNGHIMIEDHAITGSTINKWVHQPSEDMLASLEKAVIQVAQVLLRVNARVVSEHYGGEDFSSGSKLCYRLTYVNQNGQMIYIYLVFEEWLAFHTLGEMLGKQIKTADKTVAYAIKILSQQLVERIGFHFDNPYGYRPAKSDMITFAQFCQTLDQEYPPYSLLFGTGGRGYFAVCIQD